MTPGTLNLPTIYRGASWPAVVITITNSITNAAYNFTGYKPFAHIRHLPTEELIFDLIPKITNGPNGEITIPEITRLVTETIATGTFRWDLLLEDASGTITGPWLAGSAIVSDIITNPIART